MQIIWFTLIGAITLGIAGCTGSSHDPLLTVDENHHIVPGDAKNNPAPYEISASSGVLLDVSQYQFKDGDKTVIPDTIQVWDNSSNPCRLHLAQPVTTNIVLDASTLSNPSGGPAFQGFRAGHKYMVNIGRIKPGDDVHSNMTYDWVGIVVVE